jgi:hypothetical protein
MGREARCSATFAGTTGEVKAHLDADSVRLRGAFRLDVAFADIHDVQVHGETLHFRAPAGTVTVSLGASEAAKWRKGILEPKSLLDKLGVKAAARVCVRGITDANFVRELEAHVSAPPARVLRGRFDAIFAQLDTPADLAALERLRAHLLPEGMLWLIAPKGKGSPLPEALLRRAYLAAGLVDVKVAAFSPTHTAVKVVIPLAQRASAQDSTVR